MSAAPLLAGLAALAAAVLAGTALRLLLPRVVQLDARVRPYTVEARVRLGCEPAPTEAAAATTGTRDGAARWVAGQVGRMIEARSDQALARVLRQAGWGALTPAAFRARQGARACLGAAAGAALGLLVLGSPLAALGSAAVGFVTGAARTRAALERAVAERAERLRLELFTVNQVLALHVRTGAGPVQAVRRVVQRGRGVMVEELGDLLDAMRRGVPEAEAFRHAAELTPEPAAARTYGLFATAAERGTDLAPALRVLATDLREARREQLRRAALARRAAMLVPTIAVLAPIMLLFIAAPIPSLIFGAR